MGLNGTNLRDLLFFLPVVQYLNATSESSNPTTKHDVIKVSLDRDRFASAAMRHRRRLTAASCTRTRRGAFPPRELSSETFGSAALMLAQGAALRLMYADVHCCDLLKDAHDSVGSVRFKDRVFPVELHSLSFRVCRLLWQELVMEKKSIIFL
jgi:hypothetical protein